MGNAKRRGTTTERIIAAKRKDLAYTSALLLTMDAVKEEKRKPEHMKEMGVLAISVRTLENEIDELTL